MLRIIKAATSFSQLTGQKQLAEVRSRFNEKKPVPFCMRSTTRFAYKET